LTITKRHVAIEIKMPTQLAKYILRLDNNLGFLAAK